MNSYIFLDNVRFFAYHGVGQQEREVGNEFVINLKLKVDIARAAETDDVTHTVSYADVYENVKAEMEIPSKLLEHVCGMRQGWKYNVKEFKKKPPPFVPVRSLETAPQCNVTAYSVSTASPWGQQHTSLPAPLLPAIAFRFSIPNLWRRGILVL